MADRREIPKETAELIMFKCRRRCCLCYGVEHDARTKKGQIAHVDRNSSNSKLDNLAYLCLPHHDEYDSRNSQTRRWTEGELKGYRDKLNEHLAALAPPNLGLMPSDDVICELRALPVADEYRVARRFNRDIAKTLDRPWQHAGSLCSNEPELFAFISRNRADGVCIIERIDLPNGVIVIACTEPAGNPGNCITNAVEEIAFQVCERFNIPANRLVWLEHYESDEFDRWDLVRFAQRPPDSPFREPTWEPMTEKMWEDLGLRLRMPSHLHGQHQLFSPIEKLFHWPR